MARTIRQVGDTVKNVLDQTVGKIPDLVKDPKGTIGDLTKIQPLKALGRLGEDVVHSGMDILGGMSRDVGGVLDVPGMTEKDVDYLKKLPLHMLMNKGAWKSTIKNMLGERTFQGLNIEDVGLFRQLGGELAQEEKLRSDVGSLVPQDRTVTESTAIKKYFHPNKTREDYEGGEKSQIERELMGLARMYAGRQQAIKGSRRRPGQRESLLTRR
tara:strand:- start:9769 stop:10407 length:639 start_codon:yes stop_codon:yes gene_type:complete